MPSDEISPLLLVGPLHVQQTTDSTSDFETFMSPCLLKG